MMAGRGVPLLCVEGLTVDFGGLRAVDDINLEVWSKEVLGLIGPNGAGKSTVLNAISRLVPANASALSFEGHNILEYAPHYLVRLGIARTFQSPKLIPDLNIFENILLGLHTRMGYGLVSAAVRTGGARRCERESVEKTSETIGLCGLERWADHAASSVPYGVRKIAEIGRAIVTRPRLLLLDEPVSGITSEEKVEIQQLLERIADGMECSVIVVDHDMTFIMGVCSRVNVMNFGKKIAEGTPQEVVRDPAVVEAYLGTPDGMVQ